VQLDERSKDGTKIVVKGLESSIKWGALKSFFAECGQVVYADIISGSTPCVGQVRFDAQADTQRALSLNGSVLGGYQIGVALHQGSKDGTKLQISNLPPGLEWQELKDHFKQVGATPAFVEVTSGSAGATAEVRYDNPQEAQVALSSLNGSYLGGAQIFIQADADSQDGSKLIVTGVPPGLEWQELKDHFGQIGKVAFAQIDAGQPGGFGKGSSKGTPCVGQVRFDSQADAQTALTLDGSVLGGRQISVALHAGSKDGTKLQIFNLPPGIEWQELKDHFKQAGVTPAFVETTGASGSCTAEVRYDNPQEAQIALTALNGSYLGGARIYVQTDADSQDGSKLIVTGVPPGIEWQELKDHFGQIGKVAFAGIQQGGKGGSKGLPTLGKGGNDFLHNLHSALATLGLTAPNRGLMNAGYGKQTFAGKGKSFGAFNTGRGSIGKFNGEVRYDFQLHAQLAIATLNGSMLGGAPITVQYDQSSQDGTKLIVGGIPRGIAWQELKDHFSAVGQVAFAKVLK